MAWDGRLYDNWEDLNALGGNYEFWADVFRLCDNEYSNFGKIANAQSRYDVFVNDAWSKKSKEDEAAKYAIDAVSQILSWTMHFSHLLINAQTRFHL